MRDLTATFEPAPTGATELNIAMEPVSDLECEPAAPSIVEGVLVEFKGMEVSLAHPPATETSSQWCGFTVGLLGVILSWAWGSLLRLQPLCAPLHLDLTP